MSRRRRIALGSVSGAALLVASLASADTGTPPKGALRDGAESLAATVEANTKSEIIKKELALLVQTARLSNPETAEEAAKEIADAANQLAMDAQETQAFFNRLKRMDREELGNLVRRQGNGVLAYGQAVLGGEGHDVARIKAALARGGDDAGLDAVRLVRRLEEGLPVSKAELMAVLKKLPPEKSTTLIDAFRSELKTGGPVRQQLADSLGTMVDGVFVFNDAVNIYYSDDPPEEKAAAATGKGAEFALGAGGGVLVAAAGGGFGAGIVLGWSAERVGTLTKEMIGLYHDRQDAAQKEEWARLELREMAIRKMLEIDALMKANKLDAAFALSSKLRTFYESHEDEIGDHVVGKSLVELDRNLSRADHLARALSILAEAKRPYEAARASYEKRVNLRAAQSSAAEARGILVRWAKSYPEIEADLGRVKKLESDIKTAIATATPVRITNVGGPPSVALGAYAQFHVDAAGGIPYYCARGGTCGSSFALLYFHASGAPGKRTVRLEVRDDIGQVAARDLTIEVLTGEPGASEATGSGSSSGTGGGAGYGALPPACQQAATCCRRLKHDAGCSSLPRDEASCRLYLQTGVCNIYVPETPPVKSRCGGPTLEDMLECDGSGDKVVKPP